MDLQEAGREGVDWIGLIQDTDKWWVRLNAVMNFRVPCNARNCCLAEERLAFQGLYSMELIVLSCVVRALQLACPTKETHQTRIEKN